MRIIDGKKSAHSATHGNNRNRDLFDGILVKFKWAWDISKDGKHLELKYVPLKECYVESGLQEKSDSYLYGRAKACHRDFTIAAWNMCCKNYKLHGIWGPDADVERKLEGAQLSECMFTKATRDKVVKNVNNKVVKNVNKQRKGNKLRGQEDVSEVATLCALFK